MIPSEREALALHRKHGSNEILVRHCQTVAEVARVLCGGLAEAGREVDADAVAAGALLHDIGRNRTPTVRHGLAGAEILEAEGVDAVVVEMVKRHVGAGLSQDEARRLGLPDMDFVPRTIEQRVVCFADKMVSTEEVRPFREEVDRFVRKGHDVSRLMALKRGLEEDLGQDPERLVLKNVKESG